MYVTLALAAFKFASAVGRSNLIMQQADLQERIDEENAKSIEASAFEAEQFGYTQAARYQNNIDQTIAAQQVGFASKGVDVTSGTAKVLQDEARLTGALNVMDMIRAGAEQANGLRFKATDVRLNSVMKQIQAESTAAATRTSGAIDAVSTGVSGYQDYSRNKSLEDSLRRRNASTNS